MYRFKLSVSSSLLSVNLSITEAYNSWSHMTIGRTDWLTIGLVVLVRNGNGNAAWSCYVEMISEEDWTDYSDLKKKFSKLVLQFNHTGGRTKDG